jgi:hypothetical protein
MTRIQGRRHKQLPDNFKETRVYWKLKEEVLERPLWRNRFGKGYGTHKDRLRNEVLGVSCSYFQTISVFWNVLRSVCL